MDGPTKRSGTRSLPRQVRNAKVLPTSIDEENRTAEVVWTTGARVIRGFWEQYYEELSLDPEHVRMGRLENGAPLLDSHRSDGLEHVVGVVESARIQGDEGTAIVRFAKDERGQQVFEKVKDGILRNISVGYAVHRMEKVEESSDGIPVLRATDWEPHELSIVPVGADAAASIRNASQTNPCEFIEKENTMETKKTEERAVAPETKTIDLDAVRNEAAQVAASEERARAHAIRRTARSLSVSGETVEKHIAEGTTVDAFRELAIEEHSRMPSPVAVGSNAISAGEDQRDKTERAASNWLIVRSGLSRMLLEDAAKRGTKLDLDPGSFRGMTLLQMGGHYLREAGQEFKGFDKMELAKRSLMQRSSGGYATTGDFPVLLENTLNKVLLAAYGITPDTWSRVCKRGSVSDFRPHPRYRRGTFGSLDTLTEGGEFRNKSIPDGRKESLSADTKGNIIGITRQSLVNDDMGAFSDLGMMFGRAAKLSVEKDFYALLALNGGLGPNMNDGNPLFDASHQNIGAGAAISSASLWADRNVLASQTDDSGNEFLNHRPDSLLVPLALGGDARVIVEAQYDPDNVGDLSPNLSRGLVRDIIDTPRMSGTRRYMFADPMDAPTVEVVFLDGQDEPFLDMEESFQFDGVRWKVRLDYGIGAIDFRGAVTNAGA